MLMLLFFAFGTFVGSLAWLLVAVWLESDRHRASAVLCQDDALEDKRSGSHLSRTSMSPAGGPDLNG